MFGWLSGKGKKEKINMQKDLLQSAASFLIDSLRIQMQEMDGIEKGLPAHATDDFSLGYIAGYTETLAQLRNIEGEQSSYVMYQVAFTELFGQAGQEILARFLKAQGEDNEEIAMGMKMGGEDLFAWLNGDKEAPREWASYVNRN